MSNSIHSTTVSPAGVVSGRSGTTLCWNKRVQFLIPHPQLLHSQPLLQSRPTSLTSDSMSSQPVISIIESNPFIPQSNPSVHLPSTNIVNALCHLSNTLGRPPIAPPVKVRVPNVFDGTDPYQLHHFLFQCRLYFRSGPTLFKLDFDKINFAMTYVSGMVQDWLQVALEQEDRGVHYVWLYSWSFFVKEMHTYFGIPDVTMELAHSLDHLRMNPDDWITIYNVAFLWYSAQLQWTENALCHRYYSGLPDCIQDIISTREGGKPSTFQTLYSTAISIDNHYWERKRESERAPYSAPQYSLYLECSKSVSHLSISNPSSNIDASESSDIYPTWQHTPPLDISDSDSGLLLSVSDSGSIVSKSSSVLFSALQQILSSELSNSDSVLSFLTSGSISRVPKSPVKLESLVDSLSGLGSSLSSESLF